MSLVSRILTRNFLLPSRYAHVAAKQGGEVPRVPSEVCEISKKDSEVTLAAVENYGPLCHLSAVVKVGARHENHLNAGICHVLQRSACLSTKDRSAFSLTRNLESLGAKLKVTANRERLIYSMQCNRDDAEVCLKILGEVVTRQAFKPWEVEGAAKHMKIDLAMHQSNVEDILMEALHRAAFRGGLENSLFAPEFLIGRHTPDMLQSFVSENFTTPNVSLLGSGVPLEVLVDFAKEEFQLPLSQREAQPSKFAPGEIRIEAKEPLTRVALAMQGPAAVSVKDVLCYGVFRHIIGGGSHITTTGSNYSTLAQAASSCTKEPFTVSSFNIAYSDVGLFGLHIVSDPKDIRCLTKAVVKATVSKASSLSEAEIEIGKKKLKSELLLERETLEDSALAMAAELSLSGKVSSLKQLLLQVDELSAADVSAAAIRCSKARPAMAAVGPLYDTPYLDEINSK